MLENLQAFSERFSGAPQLSLFLKLDANKDDVAEVESRLKQQPACGELQIRFSGTGARTIQAGKRIGGCNGRAWYEIRYRMLL